MTKIPIAIAAIRPTKNSMKAKITLKPSSSFDIGNRLTKTGNAIAR